MCKYDIKHFSCFFVVDVVVYVLIWLQTYCFVSDFMGIGMNLLYILAGFDGVITSNGTRVSNFLAD